MKSEIQLGENPCNSCQGCAHVVPASAGPESSALVRSQLPVTATPDDSDSDLLHIRASDETLDRYREVISASGWKLDTYNRNPVIQNAHQYGDIIFTIGRAEKTWVSGNALLQTWRFASNENPFAKIARDLYRGQFLKAASVGFIPIRWEDGTEKTAYRRRYVKQELIEVSAVGIPANPNALTLAYGQGAIAKSDLRELYKLLSHLVSDPQPEGLKDISRGSAPSHGAPPPVNVKKDSHPEGVPQSYVPTLRRLERLVRQINQLF